jgi:hypothetical protein
MRSQAMERLLELYDEALDTKDETKIQHVRNLSCIVRNRSNEISASVIRDLINKRVEL